MNNTKRLWIILGAVILSTMMVLGWFGRELYRKVPPIPFAVKTVSGETLMTREDILKGQQAWQSIGGQQVGSIWGHGAYQAPDWSADWLHREAVALRDLLSRKHYNEGYRALGRYRQAEINERLQAEVRSNTYDQETGTVTLSGERAQAIAATADHYIALFGDDPLFRTCANHMPCMNRHYPS